MYYFGITGMQSGTAAAAAVLPLECGLAKLQNLRVTCSERVNMAALIWVYLLGSSCIPSVLSKDTAGTGHGMVSRPPQLVVKSSVWAGAEASGGMPGTCTAASFKNAGGEDSNICASLPCVLACVTPGTGCC